MSRPTDPEAWVDPVSGGPLDTPPMDGPPLDAPRYELGGLLGRGGMGEVRLARDTRLGRDVALKTSRPDAAEAARLVREAAMTARLEHPGIIPVHDAGRGPDGAPFYTMRLLPGRSLAEVLRETPPGAARLRLVRHLVDAAEAVAYAHGRGILHRDLKPANIMVGAFGETVVADWGLACTLEEAARPRAGGAGSPGYTSPEQASGAPLDGRTDVYGLGAVLYELLVGRPRPDGPFSPVRSAAPDAPAALAAIADRALQPDPADRYPSAGAFADDLLAWYEGRRVSTHTYTVRELAQRIVAAWRVPLAVGAVGVLALLAALASGWWSTAREQARALASEAHAVAAREAEADALAQALVAQARTAAAADRPMEAEILAANALLRAPSPYARGVLARFGGSPRLSLVAHGPPLPGCDPLALSPGADALLCASDAGVTWLDPARPAREPPVATGRFVAAALVSATRAVLGDEAGGLWVWDPPTPPRKFPIALLRTTLTATPDPTRVTVLAGGGDYDLDLATGAATPLHSCGVGGNALHGVRGADGVLRVVCADGRVVLHPDGDAPRDVYVVTQEDGTPTRVEPVSGGRLLVGTAKGRVLLVRPGAGMLARRTFGNDAVEGFAVDGARVVVSTVGRLYAWDLDRDALLASLPVGLHRAAWRADGTLRIVTEHAEDRRVPTAAVDMPIVLPGGVAGLAVSPDGARVAVGTGDGSVSVIDLAAARVERQWRWQDGVAKDVAWSPDGRSLAVATASGDGQRVIDAATGVVLATLSERTARRAAWLPEGLLVANYQGDVSWWPRPGVGSAEAIAPLQLVELEEDAEGLVALDVDRAVYRLVPGSRPRLRSLGRQVDALSVAPLGEDVLVGTRRVLRRLDDQGRSAAEIPVPSSVLDIAVSADRQLVALAHMDGTTTLWRPGDDAPVARLEGHTARVSAVAITPDGSRVVTGAWDGTVRVWSTAALEEPAEGLARRLEGEWGRGLEEVLGGR